MRKIKKILSIVFVLAIMASICIVPASAEEANPYAAPACSCGGRTNLVDTSYGNYLYYNTTTCTHVQNPSTYDTIQRRLVIRYYECRSCGDDLTSKTYEYRTICSNS